MNKIHTIFFLLILVAISFVFGQRIKRNSIIQYKSFQSNSNEFNLYGKWRIVRFTAGNVAAFTDDEAKGYINKEITLQRDIVAIFGDSCKSPLYDIHKENSDKYIDINYRVSKSSLNIETNEIMVAALSCKEKPQYANANSPDFSGDIIFCDEKTIIMPYNGVFFYLEKVPTKTNKKIVPFKGDTVKCMYGDNNSGCTGYVIQGTRKKGKVIHVKPLNKNVPLESEEDKNKK